MKTATLCATLALGLTWAWCNTPTPAVPDNAEARKVQTLVKRLNDSRFTVREEADRALRNLGIRAVPLLRKELGQPPSLEGQRRLEKIIAHLTRLDWHRDLAEARRAAGKQNKPLLVFSTMGEPSGFA
jgi:hypothetical protein